MQVVVKKNRVVNIQRNVFIVSLQSRKQSAFLPLIKKIHLKEKLTKENSLHKWPSYNPINSQFMIKHNSNSNGTHKKQ